MRAVILAGGRGTRLAPYTSVLPKPLMPIGDKPILEIVLRRLAETGFTDVTLCVGYLAHLIRAVMENGGQPLSSIHVTYAYEHEPLGTAGPLRLVDGLDSTFLAMNGDVLTTLDFADLVDYHKASGHAITIACHKRVNKIDYGVLHLDEHEQGIRRVHAYEEKPEIPLVVSMGIYVLEPEALGLIPSDEYFDIPDLVRVLLERELPVGAYLYDGFWLDIGRHEDYERAVEEWELLEGRPTPHRTRSD